MISAKPIFLADTASALTGIYHTVGLVGVKVNLADGTIHEAVYGLSSDSGTAAATLLAGDSNDFGTATATDAKTNLDFTSGQLRITNQMAQSGEFLVFVLAGV